MLFLVLLLFFFHFFIIRKGHWVVSGFGLLDSFFLSIFETHVDLTVKKTVLQK